jgi:RNA polymerase sigma factor (sigma-70 family)
MQWEPLLRAQVRRHDVARQTASDIGMARVPHPTTVICGPGARWQRSHRVDSPAMEPPQLNPKRSDPDDRQLVAALVAGDGWGLTVAYYRYAAAIHSFCFALLQDRHAAEDAVQDVFVVLAERIGQLRKPDRLRAWLYTVARRHCYRQLKARRRTAPLTAEHDFADELQVLDHDLHAAELHTLVWQAMAGLNPRERAAVELSLRQALCGQKLADALGISRTHANTLLTRGRQQLARSLTVLLVSRTAGRHCPTLASIIAGWDGHLTPLWRKRIASHIETCRPVTQDGVATSIPAPCSLPSPWPLSWPASRTAS